MSTSVKLGDEFLQIPKLEVSGTNWMIFKDHFTWALDARGILDHIDMAAMELADLSQRKTWKRPNQEG